MQAVRKLRLVRVDAQLDFFEAPARAVFDHWVFMLGKNPRRCAFGDSRKRAVADALKLYDAETLMLAVEGCAADPWANGDNNLGREFNDLVHLLANEERIERYAQSGERLRLRAQAWADKQAQACNVVALSDGQPLDDAKQREEALAARQRVLDYLQARKAALGERR